MPPVFNTVHGQPMQHMNPVSLQMEFAGSANEAGEEALEKEGITLDTFRAAIEKHSSSPAVGRTLTMLQMKQQQELMALGVPSM